MEKEEILFVSKSELKTYPLNVVIDTFKTTDDPIVIKNIIENAEDRVYTSWASVDAIDNANERIPIEDVIKQQDILLKRGGSISNEHTNAIVGKTLAYKVAIHPITKTLGVLHLNQIYNDNIKDNEVWGDIVAKKKTGSSIGGVHSPKDSYSTFDSASGSFVRTLSGLGQYETAVTEKPCNKYATIEASSLIAKSEKMVKEDIKKEDNLVVDEAPVAEEDSFKQDVMAAMQKFAERLDSIEENISGGASQEDPVEVKESEEEEKAPEEEEKAPEEDETKKALTDIKKELDDLKKSMVAEVVKTARPAQPTAQSDDIMKSIDNKIDEMKESGKFNFAEVGAEIRKAQEKELAKKFVQ